MFACRHRHGAGDQTRGSCDQNIGARCRCRCNANDQACGGDNPINGAENRCAQPADAIDRMTFDVKSQTTHRLAPLVRVKSRMSSGRAASVQSAPPCAAMILATMTKPIPAPDGLA